MRSLWQLDAPVIPADPFPERDEIADVAIVGAGLAGLTTALLFARRGLRVVVLEAIAAGAGTTGRTTAKVSQLQGTRLQHIRGRTTDGVVSAYVASQRAAFEWLREFTTSTGVPFESRDAATVAFSPEGRDAVETEHRLARAHGLATYLSDVDLPYPTFGAVRLAGQAQIEPMLLLAALASEFRALGGLLIHGARVTGVRVHRLGSAPAVVRSTAGELRADRVVITTGMPVLDRGLYFAKLAPSRSYAQAWRVPEAELPDAMVLSADEPTRSVRDARGLLLTGGYGHGVGRVGSERAHADALAEWSRRGWPGAELVAEWSAQDHLPTHGVPFVGRLPRGAGRVHLATGFAKVGMTNAVAAALTLEADVLGDGEPWQRTLRRRATLPLAVAAGIGYNAAVAAWYARGWLRGLGSRLPESATEGMGLLGRRGVLPAGVSRVGGITREVCAVCPHKGAVVQWNDFEQSWDCPAHGSRFAPDGSVLEGPAKHPLRRLSEPTTSDGAESTGSRERSAAHHAM